MTHRILVLGAGYCGLLAAKRIAARLQPGQAQVTVVNAGDRFLQRVRLHQLSAGQRLQDLTVRQLLAGTGIDLVLGLATEIHTADREVIVETEDGTRQLEYNTLVYALGSRADRGSVPGAADHAASISDMAGARRLQRRIADLDDGQVVAVVGGGMAAIETAAELAETHQRLQIKLVSEEEPGAWLIRRARRHLYQTCRSLGLNIHIGVPVAEVFPDHLHIGEEEDIDSDLTVWATNFTVSSLAREAGLAVDSSGRIHVDSTMRSGSHHDIYAVGAAAAVTGPHGVQLRIDRGIGMPMAFQAADAITARLSGHQPHRFGFRFIHQAISLGRHDGIVQFTRPDDTPTPTVLTGRAAVLYKELLTRSALWVLRHPGPYLPHRRLAITAEPAVIPV